MIIPPDFEVDFGSRNLPGELTVVNVVRPRLDGIGVTMPAD